MTAHSATLAIDEAVATRRQAGHTVLHLGFGEAGLPVLPSLVEILTAAGERNGYGPVAGSLDARAAAAGWFTRRGVATEPEQIIFAPGSKPLLFALLAAVDGDLVLPRPSWVSYAAHAAMLGRRVISVPIPPEGGGVPDPDRLDDALVEATRRGAEPRALVLTIPDNPTGTIASPQHVQAACRIAERHGLMIICDEIYAELCHRDAAPSAVAYLPERTIITSGLSKSLALGGWRIGYARTPDGEFGRGLHRKVTGIASEIWSGLAAPMQAVAAHVLSDPPDVARHIAASRRLHARVAAIVHADLIEAGAHCRAPQAGFYLYPDFAPVERTLATRGINTSADLAAALLEEQGIAVLPGQAFGDPASAMTIRIATSLLYGTTPEQRWSALAADHPETLPWIADARAHLRRGLGALTDGDSP